MGPRGWVPDLHVCVCVCVPQNKFSLGKGHLPAWLIMFYKCKNMWEVSPTSSMAG